MRNKFRRSERKALATELSITADDDREFIKSLAKGLAVIECFGADAPALSLSQVARRAAISPGSARRILMTLERLGYVASDGGRFSLQPRTLQLGYAYLSSLPLTRLVQPQLTRLTRDLDESCSLAVLNGLDVVYIARATARRLTHDYMSVGIRFPAYATSVGKVLLAALPEAELSQRLRGVTLQQVTMRGVTNRRQLLADLADVRRRGWALNDQETILGLRSIAVPVRRDGLVVAALGMSTEAERTSIEIMRTRLLPALQEAATALSALLDARAVT
jgi:IclR family pca regulon transcriptional regulator